MTEGTDSQYTQCRQATSYFSGMVIRDGLARCKGWGLYAYAGPPRREDARNDFGSFRHSVYYLAWLMGRWPARRARDECRDTD